MTRLNPVLVGLLHSPLHFIASIGLMSLTYQGRRSGRTITIPVGYQRRGDEITVLVSKAPRKTWWRNFDQPIEVELRVRGRKLRGQGALVAADEPRFRLAFETTLERLPSLQRQFGLDDYRKGHALSDAQLSVLAEQGRVVLITLNAEGASS